MKNTAARHMYRIGAADEYNQPKRMTTKQAYAIAQERADKTGKPVPVYRFSNAPVGLPSSLYTGSNGPQGGGWVYPYDWSTNCPKCGRSTGIDGPTCGCR